MRRFELVEGKSSKFWEIAQEGASVTVRFGHIGTNGQVQEKSFDTEDKAKSHHDKLVAEKVKKGYAEVAAGAAPMPAAPKPKAAAPKKPEKVEAEKPEVSEPEAVAPSITFVAPASPIVATDPSTWPAELRAELHPSRQWPAAPIALDREAIWKKLRARGESSKSTAAEAAGRLRLESAEPPTEVAADDVELSVARLVIEAPLPYRETRWIVSGVELVIDHWVATSGIEAALRLATKLATAGLTSIHFGAGAIWDRLAHHVSNAPEAEWARARDVMIELAGQPAQGPVSPNGALAYLFPETGEGDRLVMRATPTQYGHLALEPLAVAGITKLDTLVHLGKTGNAYHLRTGGSWRNASADSTLLTFVARFGEDVIDPFLALMDREHTDAESTRALSRAIALVGTPRAFEVLAARATEKNVVVSLREAALRSPDAALGPLAQAASGRSASAQAVRAILAQIVRAQDVSAAESVLPESLRAVIAELRAMSGADREEASLDEIPPVLARPPWLEKKKKAEATVVEGVTPLPWIDTMRWPAGVREKWRAYQPPPWAQNRRLDEWLGVPADLIARLEREEPVAIEALRNKKHSHYATVHAPVLAVAPLGLARSVIVARASWRFWDEADTLRKLAAEHEVDFLAPLLAFAEHHIVEGLSLLLPYSSPRIALMAADAALRLKKAQASGRAWLAAHPEAAAIGLVPIAAGKRGKDRDTAEHALRMLAREGHEELVMDVAARHGDAVREAVRAILDFDPRDLFPKKMPKLPDFAAPAALPRPVLRESGKAIPAAAMENVLLVLAISRADAPYQGLLDLKEACTPESLAELSWELFQAWLVAGANSKEGWAFSQLGFLGDDECARRLAPLIRAWPGESAHARAVSGLDVLANIGTDVALMHLHGISQKVKFKGLQEQARQKIDAIAEARGLSPDELADRLVPDLGLDEQGTLILDFGPRTFRVGFDEALKPFVRDAENARLGDLPKPRKDDDAEKAKAATALWKALKKDAKTIAKQQVLRLESAMCARRRWTDEVFRRFLVEHPLVRHLVVRLVWGVYENDALKATFRVAEDGTFADANDDAWTLPEESTIGIPHTLELSVADAERFGQTFGDYEILQPFKQLGRETYALTDEEKKEDRIMRYEKRVVPTGSVLGLESRGWRRGAPQDAGISHWYEREVPGPNGETVMISFDFEPGIIAGIATEWNEQTIHGAGIGVDWYWRKTPAATTLGDLHPIVTSEILRDLESLVSGGAA